MNFTMQSTVARKNPILRRLALASLALTLTTATNSVAGDLPESKAAASSIRCAASAARARARALNAIATCMSKTDPDSCAAHKLDRYGKASERLSCLDQAGSFDAEVDARASDTEMGAGFGGPNIGGVNWAHKLRKLSRAAARRCYQACRAGRGGLSDAACRHSCN